MVNEKIGRKQKSWLLKASILCISITIQAAGAVAGAVPSIMLSFENKSTAQIQALLTIPSFAIMVFIILSSWIIKKIGKRNTVVLGLLVSLVGGVLPAFTTNFTLIIIGRVLFGAGTGMYNSLTVSLIGDFFTGEEQQTMLGLQSAIMTLGNSLATFLAGWLLNYGWQNSFLVYFLIVPVLILFLTGYPKNSNQDTENLDSSSKEIQQEKLSLSHTFSISVVLGILTLFLFFISVMSLYTTSALAIQELDLANQDSLSTLLAIGGIISSLFAMIYGKINQMLGKITPVVCTFIGICGMFLLTISSSMTMFFIGIILTLVSNLIVPYVYSLILGSVPEGNKNLIVSLAMVACNLGAFLSPYVINGILNIIGSVDALSQFRLSAIILIIILLIFIFLSVTQKSSNQNRKGATNNGK